MAYYNFSIDVKLEWGRKLLEKRQWVGNEIVMDAGAGSGNLTKILADKVPNGQVDAVDALSCVMVDEILNEDSIHISKH